ncbi:MAG: hypothetical protein PUP93_05795 [Rhizonema sp. NSF051]|nr:hypothetical protein [Rhizonema sp. NSF051]
MWWKQSYIVILLLVLSTLTILYLWTPLDDSDCNVESFLASKTETYQVQATKVVVKPWLGEHHVYGIFIVPDEYKEAPFFVLTVKGIGSDCERPFGHFQNFEGITALPGTHIIRDYIRTRTALRIILQGMYTQVKEPQNWTLTYPLLKPGKTWKLQ